MRRLFCLAALAGLAVSSAGCFLPIYPADPNRRMRALLVDSENLRQIQDEWDRIWFHDMPSHMTFDRIDGGIVDIGPP
jgi:hypothetical protein